MFSFQVTVKDTETLDVVVEGFNVDGYDNYIIMQNVISQLCFICIFLPAPTVDGCIVVVLFVCAYMCTSFFQILQFIFTGRQNRFLCRAL